MRMRLVKRSTALSTTVEMIESDPEITAPTILMMTRIFDQEKNDNEWKKDEIGLNRQC